MMSTMLHIPRGISSLKTLSLEGDPSFRISIEYEPQRDYDVPAAIADASDLENPPPELLKQFISPRRVTAPGRSLTYLRDCIVLPNAAIITKGGAIIRESCFPYADRKQVLKMFHPWLIERDGEIYANLENLESVNSPVIYLREHGEMGFFHWMHSVFPRIDVIENQRIHPEFMLLIQSRAKYQVDSLKLFDFRPREILEPSIHHAQSFKELLFPSALVENGDFWLRTLSVKAFYSKLQLIEGHSHKRIYISRQDAGMRRLANETDMMNILNLYGFVSVELGQMGFAEQLALFREVELVVGVHGAGLAHIINMKPASGVLEILHPRRFWSTYRAMASRAGIQYGFVVGEDLDRTKEGDSFDFEIDLKKFETVLQSVIHAL